MIKLTEVVVKRPVAAVMIIVATVIFGAMALFTMPQELTPSIEVPMLIISTVYPGAGPEDIEAQVSREIEDAVGNLSGVTGIQSNSMENISIVVLQYEYGTDTQSAYADAKVRMDSLVNTLPDECQTPTVMELDINAMPTMTLSVTSETQENLLLFVQEEIVPQLEKLSSVSSVEVSGGQEDYIRVEVREEMLQEYGISLATVMGAVSNSEYSAPLGAVDYGDQDVSVRTEVRYETLAALNSIPVPLRGGDVIRLADVANITMSVKDAESISRYNSSDNISLSIQKRQSASAVAVSEDVMAILSELTNNNPDIGVHIVNDNSERISSSISSIAQTMILAIILSMIVLYVFFGDMRASIIVGSSMPISLLFTFILMNFMGYSLNVVSMSGLVLGVGMMVDNAIVVLDSCFKSSTHGKSLTQAAIDGTKFVLLSIFAGTLTTVVVFLPLAMINGMAGQLFGPLGFSIVFALLASLFSAITLVPLFFVRFKPIEKKNAIGARLLKRVEHGYARLLRNLLRHKKTVVAVTAIFLAASLFLATQLNFELMPESDDGIIDIAVETKPGLQLEQVNEVLVELEAMVASHPDVENYSLTSGGSGLTAMMGGESSTLTAYLRDDRTSETADVIALWQHDTRNLANCDIDISKGSTQMAMASGNGIDIVLEGDDLDTTIGAVAQIEDVMLAHPDILRVSSTVDRANLQAEIVVDPLKGASKGLTPQQVTAGVYTAINGAEASEVRVNGQNVSVWVEYPKGRYQSLRDVEDMLLVSSTGALVPLSEVATVQFSDTPQTISRDEGAYVVTVTGVPTQEARFTAQKEVNTAVNAITLPQGVSIGQNARDERMNEEFSSLGMAIIVAVLLVFMVMAVQFNSIRYAVMVMFCIPFAAIGSFALMYFTNTTISMVALLGFLILVGTVVNNGILFVDTTNQYRETMDLNKALIRTGRTRLRPILMTTLTTILSMLPLAFGIGEGAEMMQGLGITVIGGLTVSTLLTLLALPIFYLILDGNREKKRLAAIAAAEAAQGETADTMLQPT